MRAKLQIQRAGQRLGQRRLADAGHVFDQHVAVAEQGHQQQLDHAILADDDLADVLFQDEGGISYHAGAFRWGEMKRSTHDTGDTPNSFNAGRRCDYNIVVKPSQERDQPGSPAFSWF